MKLVFERGKRKYGGSEVGKNRKYLKLRNHLTAACDII